MWSGRARQCVSWSSVKTGCPRDATRIWDSQHTCRVCSVGSPSPSSKRFPPPSDGRLFNYRDHFIKLHLPLIHLERQRVVTASVRIHFKTWFSEKKIKEENFKFLLSPLKHHFLTFYGSLTVSPPAAVSIHRLPVSPRFSLHHNNPPPIVSKPRIAVAVHILPRLTYSGISF